ncbi:MAG: YhcH/YjgK/YiaL family protein, partial [Peptacetobacter hiranonis]|nr:YhcH/YjgK/YiaL family protein [Peptacetobacter hiranonis]
MIFGNINYDKTNSVLPEDIKKCFEYAKENNLLDFEKGSHVIDGD